jgi:hypothetical protein
MYDIAQLEEAHTHATLCISGGGLRNELLFDGSNINVSPRPTVMLCWIELAIYASHQKRDMIDKVKIQIWILS